MLGLSRRVAFPFSPRFFSISVEWSEQEEEGYNLTREYA